MKFKMNLKSSIEEFNSLLQVASAPTAFPGIVLAAVPAVIAVADATPKVAKAMKGKGGRGQDFDDPISINQSIDTTGLSIKELISLRNQFA
jgi:hypothetical protein